MILKMKLSRLVFILVILVMPSLSFGNDNANALFLKANAYYTKGQYKEVLGAYRQIVDEGYQSAPLYFNLGNAFYKTGDIPSALLYYEKAHKLAPGDDDINFNIRFVNSRTTDKVGQNPEFFLYSWWKTFMLNFSIGTLSAMSIVFIFLASAMLILYFFATSVSLKKASFYTSLLLSFLFALTFFIASEQTAYFEGHRQAIVFTSSVSVKNSPANSSNALFVIHDGTKVNILETNNGWLKIALPYGNEGWIHAADAKEI